jgi:predicted SAM-dependent methyltransferase
VKRLNWGCGAHTQSGWINADVDDGPQVDLACDIRAGLPIESDSLDYVVSVHALQELAYEEVVPALEEIRRVLRPAGVLRLVLPDLSKGIRAYVLHKEGYFDVDEEEVTSPGGRFITHMLWHGHSRMLFTPDFVEELLVKAQFVDIAHCWYQNTASRFPEITELDNREQESLYIEGTNLIADGSAAPASGRISAGEGREPPPKGAKARGRGIEVSDIARGKDDRNELLAYQVREPKPGLFKSRRLPISGWVVGRSSPAAHVEVVHGDKVVARSRVELKRPAVARRFSDVPHARTSGFEMTVEAAGTGESDLHVNAVLEDDTRVPIATISMRVRAPDAGPDARTPKKRRRSG